MKYLPLILAVLVAVQLAEGTTLVIAVEFCCFVVVSVLAFNTAGGMVYPSGAYIAFTTVFTGILGGLVKILLGEPLQGNLTNAEKTLMVYLAGSCALLAAAALNRVLRREQPFLNKVQFHRDTIVATAVGSALLGLFASFLVPLEYTSTFTQLNQFFMLSLMMVVYQRAKDTGGHKTFSMLALVVCMWTALAWGLLAFSKQGMFAGLTAWALCALAAGYWITLRRLVLMAALVGGAIVVLTPYAQIGRAYRTDPKMYDRIAYLLSHPLETRQRYLQQEEVALNFSDDYHWFNRHQGLVDRLTMVPIDDALIYVTDRGTVQGVEPLITYVTNMVPRYFVKHKQTYLWGNVYAHQVGLLPEKDESTGVSFSPFADGYHCARWVGVTVIAFGFFFALFWVTDSMTGTTDHSIWALIYILYFVHAGPEGMLSAPTNTIAVITVAVVVCALTVKHVCPVVGGMILPAQRTPSLPLQEPVTYVPAESQT